MTRLRSILFASVMAATSLGGTAAQAQQYYPPGPPPGYHHHHWRQGERFYGDRHFVHDWRRFNLPPPPYGYVWIRDNGRFLLVGGDGMISRVWGP